MTLRRRALLIQALVAALVVAVLCGLGSWQLRRLAWKEALLARIETRLSAPAQAFPAQGDWAKLAPEDYEFLRVNASGRFDPSREARVFSPPPEDFGPEPGYFVLTPFLLEDGGAVLVERGFIPLSQAEAIESRRPAATPAALSGFLRPAPARNAFTPKDQPEKGIFYASDPARIAAALKLDGVAPFVLQLETPAGAAAEGQPQPLPPPVAASIANNHLAYAFVWFSLAAADVVIFLLRLRQKARGG